MLTAALWLIGAALLAFALAVLLGTLLDYDELWRLRAKNPALQDELIDATLRVVALTVERDRLRRQQFSGPLTLCYRDGTRKTIRVRPWARMIPFWIPGN